MAFTVQDFPDLIRLLEEHPDWRAELRRVLLGDEILALPAIVARLAAAVEKLAEDVRHLTERMDAVESRLERVEDTQVEHGHRFDRPGWPSWAWPPASV